MEEKIGKRIKKVRDTYNLSQKRFGKKIGISSKTISAYETGRITPTYKVLENISEVYNVNIFKIPNNKRNTLLKKLTELDDSIKEVRNLLDLEL